MSDAPSRATLATTARAVLSRAGVPDPALDAEILLAHVSGCARADLHRDPGRPVPDEIARRYQALVTRRATREPLQYLTGVQEFWSLEFAVSSEVLIPRPETELIVAAFLRLNARPDPLVVDVGTGSGCVAVAAAHAVPGARVHACDVSAGALAMARRNAERHDVAARLTFHRGDLLEALQGPGLRGGIDFILSNPPYVAESDVPSLPPEVRLFEPRAALVAGADGLAVHRRLAAAAATWLRPGGRLIVEIGIGQEPGIRALHETAGLAVEGVEPDLAGIPRVCVARRPAGR